ncbi:hypothetical protein LXL04_025075 [Taraxacum kok-saghyz]
MEEIDFNFNGRIDEEINGSNRFLNRATTEEQRRRRGEEGRTAAEEQRTEGERILAREEEDAMEKTTTLFFRCNYIQEINNKPNTITGDNQELPEYRRPPPDHLRQPSEKQKRTKEEEKTETVVFLFTTTVTASTPASDEPPLLPTDKPLPLTNHRDVDKPPEKHKQTTGKNRNESEADSEEVVALTDSEWNHRRKLPETARTCRKMQETSSNPRKPPETAGEIAGEISADATYKTNKYNMAFVEIVGVTSTNKTFSIAFAFIMNEKEESYNWVLSCLRSTLENCMHPRVIVTDRDLALMNASRRVFPNAARLLCRWHITENIRKNCRTLFNQQADWDSFRAMWTILVDSPTLVCYNKNYEKLQSMLRKIPLALKYMDENWLLHYKEMFVSVWIDQHLNFEERTTNRFESQHSKLKKYIGPKNYSLDKFIGSIDQLCVKLFFKFKEDFNEQPKFVKKNMLTRLRDFFQPSKTRIKEPAIQKKYAWKTKFEETSKKRADAASQAPKRCSYSTTSKFFGLDQMESNQESARHSSYVSTIPDLNEVPQSCYINPLMNEIPDMFHPYISHIQNVAVMEIVDFEHYGIKKLETYLSFFQTNAPREHWMIMPLTGFLIANRFGVIVIFLTKRGSITIFPLWKGPEEFQYHQMITISLVYDNHYVMVQLERDFSMPTIPAYLRRHKNSCVPRWEAVYKLRLELYQQLKPRDREQTFITIEDC